MERFRFSEISVLIADSTELSAITTRDILHNRGIRNFTFSRDMEKTRDVLGQKEFDLLLVNSHLNNDSITPLLHDVRQGDLGKNPFIPVISLAWEPSTETVGNMLGCGVDVILTLPLTAEKVDKALEHLIMRRKPFVVTADYIGPDRRSAPRPNTAQAPQTVVPNPIKRKALGRDDVGDHGEILKAVYDQRVESYISRITFTIGKISGLTGRADQGTMSDWLEELRVISTNLSYRIAETSYAHQSALCRTLIDVANGLDQRDTLQAADLELLQQIALALEIAVKQDDASTVHAALSIEKVVETTIVGNSPAGKVA